MCVYVITAFVNDSKLMSSFSLLNNSSLVFSSTTMLQNILFDFTGFLCNIRLFTNCMWCTKLLLERVVSTLLTLFSQCSYMIQSHWSGVCSFSRSDFVMSWIRTKLGEHASRSRTIWLEFTTRVCLTSCQYCCHQMTGRNISVYFLD